MAVWAGLAAAVRWAVDLRSASLRLWVWAGAFAALFAVSAAVPAALGRRGSLSSLVASVAVAAVVVVLPLVAVRTAAAVYTDRVAERRERRGWDEASGRAGPTRAAETPGDGEPRPPGGCGSREDTRVQEDRAPA